MSSELVGNVDNAAAARSPDRPGRALRLARVWRSPHTSLGLLALGLAAWLASRLLPALPLFADRAYGSGIGGALSRPLSLLTGAVPFSVVETLLVVYVLWILVTAGRGIARVRQRRRTLRDSLRHGALRVARHAGALLVLFYLLWGMNYARPTFAAQAGWPDFDGIEAAELTALLEAATLAANRAYIELHGTDDAGAPTSLPGGRAERRRLEAAIDEGWRRAADVLALPSHAAARYGAVKWPASSPLIARLGIGGMYTPFTAEANVVRGMPALRVPITMAHEKAHQRGVSREADANFLGFVAAAHAPDPLARYSAAMFAQQQLLGLALFRVEGDVLRDIVDRRVPGIRRDLDDARAYYLRMYGFAADFGGMLNNSFLMAQGIDHGVEDYRRSVFLIVGWARQHEGTLLP